MNEHRMKILGDGNDSKYSSMYQHNKEQNEVLEYLEDDEKDLESITQFLTKYTKLIHPAKSKSKLKPNLNLMTWQS
jgi:hypothetical protein